MLIGGGAFGIVEKISNNTALKRIPHAENMFFPLELSIMKSYTFPYLNDAIDIDIDDKETRIYQDLALCNLNDVIFNGGMTNEKCLLWSYQLISAINFLHMEEIIHSDLKPSNILVFGDYIKLADFGLANLIPKKLIPRELTGTLRYAAPEQILSGIWNKSADIWAFGCILYEMITQNILLPGQMSSQVDKRMKKLSLRLKTALAQRKYVNELGQHIDMTFPKLNFNSIDSKLSRNSIFWSLFEGCIQWNPRNRLTAWEIRSSPLYSSIRGDESYKIHKASPPDKNLDLDRLKIQIDEYLKFHFLTHMDKYIRKKFYRLYLSAKSLLSEFNSIELLDTSFHITISLYHCYLNDFNPSTSKEKMRRISRLFLIRNNFNIHNL